MKSSGYVLQVSSHSVERMPIKIGPLGYDVLCVPTSARASQFLNNVVFHNYYIQYTDAAYNVACHNNSIFDT